MCAHPEQPGTDDFGQYAQDITNTDQGRRERDVAEVTQQTAATLGVIGTSEHHAFLQAQAAQGDAITRDPDPDRRAELRDLREADAQDYAAGLSDRLAKVSSLMGQDGEPLQQMAEARREIAAELRGTEHPEPPTHDPDRDFKEAAALASGLGKSAETVLAVEMPTRPGETTTQRDVAPVIDPQGMEIRSRAGEGDYAALREATAVQAEEPQAHRPEFNMTRAITVGVGPGGAEIFEISQNRPDIEAHEPDAGSQSIADQVQRSARAEATTDDPQHAVLEDRSAPMTGAERRAADLANVEAAYADLQAEKDTGLEQSQDGGRTGGFSGMGY